VSFLGDLRSELAAHGIRGRLAARIEAEFADHLACDPTARLGTPAEIAERFAAELRVVRTRRASIGTFAALGVTALLLAALAGTQRAGSPFAAIGFLAFGQIAFVAGTLALWRGLRGRTAGDFRIAQRRGLVALAAGGVVCASLVADVGPLALAVAPLLAAAAVATRRAAALTPAAPAEGLSADFGRHAGLVLLALGAIAVGVVVFQGIAFEDSGWEGVIRGAIEAGGLAAGVAVLGRPLALRS
jgi:hypothetical protein